MHRLPVGIAKFTLIVGELNVRTCGARTQRFCHLCAGNRTCAAVRSHERSQHMDSGLAECPHTAFRKQAGSAQ